MLEIFAGLTMFPYSFQKKIQTMLQNDSFRYVYYASAMVALLRFSILRLVSNDDLSCMKGAQWNFREEYITYLKWSQSPSLPHFISPLIFCSFYYHQFNQFEKNILQGSSKNKLKQLFCSYTSTLCYWENLFGVLLPTICCLISLHFIKSVSERNHLLDLLITLLSGSWWKRIFGESSSKRNCFHLDLSQDSDV